MYRYSKHGGAAQTVEPTMAGRGIYIFFGTPKNWPRDTPKNAISNRDTKTIKNRRNSNKSNNRHPF
jgi:hypothetical protein